METVNVIVNGHSGAPVIGTSEILPANMQVRFYANQGEVCHVQNDLSTLKQIYNYLSEGKGYNVAGNSNIENYEIEFEPNAQYQGVLNAFTLEKYPFPQKTTFYDIIQYFSTDPSKLVVIYAIWCRGKFQPGAVESDLTRDAHAGQFSQQQGLTWSSDSDNSFDMDMEHFGGRKKRKRKKKRKTKRRYGKSRRGKNRKKKKTRKKRVVKRVRK